MNTNGRKKWYGCNTIVILFSFCCSVVSVYWSEGGRPKEKEKEEEKRTERESTNTQTPHSTRNGGWSHLNPFSYTFSCQDFGPTHTPSMFLQPPGPEFKLHWGPLIVKLQGRPYSTVVLNQQKLLSIIKTNMQSLS